MTRVHYDARPSTYFMNNCFFLYSFSVKNVHPNPCNSVCGRRVKSALFFFVMEKFEIREEIFEKNIFSQKRNKQKDLFVIFPKKQIL